jgi:PAS domain S-box-containing protein
VDGRAAAEPARGGSADYLRAELYQLVREDPAIFDFLQDGSLDGLWYWDIDNPHEEWMSPRLKEVFGYTDDEVPNTSTWWQAQIFPDDLQLALDNFARHLADPHHRYDQIVRYRHRDGSTVWVRCRGIAVRDATGRATRLLGAHTDVTAIKRVEQELAEHAVALEAALDEVAAANQLKAEVSGMLNHEINQPLCVLTNYSSLLLTRWDAAPDDRRRSWLQSVDEAGRELSRVIADLMLMFRLDSAAVPVSQAAVDVRATVEQAMHRLPGVVGPDIDAADGLSVLCDPGHLRHAFVNLLTNAVQYGRGPFGVEAIATGRRCRITVTDSGDGVPAEFAPLLFDRFTRAESAAGLGAGLGLYVVEQVMRANGGSVRYEPGWPHGARFVLELDLAGAPSDDPQPASVLAGTAVPG